MPIDRKESLAILESDLSITYQLFAMFVAANLALARPHSAVDVDYFCLFKASFVGGLADFSIIGFLQLGRPACVGLLDEMGFE